jgi:hypothetical protein
MINISAQENLVSSTESSQWKTLLLSLQYFKYITHAYISSRNNIFFVVRIQVLTAASMKLRIFWDVLPCS